MDSRTITDSVDMHNVIVKDYAARLMKEENHKQAHEISKILPIKKGDIILDVGAGIGRVAKAILEDHPYIKKYYALEPGKLADYFIVNDDRVELFRSLGQNIPLYDNICDLVFAAEVFCHLKKKKDQLDILREMQRVTKPNGFVCIISTRCDDVILSFFARVLHIKREGYFKAKSKSEDGQDVYCYRRLYGMGEMKSLLRNSNLTLVRMISMRKKFWIFNIYYHIISQKIVI